MNFSAIAGLALTCTAILLGIALGGPLEFFFDPISLGLALTITPMLLFVAHRSEDVLSYGLGGLIGFLFPDRCSGWRPEERLKAARISNSAGSLATMAGAICMLIGCIQMLQAMDDPSKIGPAMAVATLSITYALLLNVLVFHPLTQHHQAAALMAGASAAMLDTDPPLRNIAVIMSLIGLSIGVTFGLMLLAMA